MHLLDRRYLSTLPFTCEIQSSHTLKLQQERYSVLKTPLIMNNSKGQQGDCIEDTYEGGYFSAELGNNNIFEFW